MSARTDAIVIGGGAEGLAAAALLAKAGLKTLLLERDAILYGHSGEAALSALDPQTIKALKLTRRGLKFTARDVSLTVLGAGGATSAIGRDRHAAAKSLGVLSPADAAAFEPWRRALFALARALRPLWWGEASAADAVAALKPKPRALYERLRVTSANAWLAKCFESEALRAALAFDAAAAGAAPSEPGSALALVWHAAQEMSGAQGAMAIPRGGALGLVGVLSEAAQKAGVEVRTAANVTRIAVTAGAVSGVQVGGEPIESALVLSTLSRQRTLGELLPGGEIGIGAARALARRGERLGTATLVYALNRVPEQGFLRGAAATRFILAERPESYEAALASVRLGRPAAEPLLEAILPPPDAAAVDMASRLQLTVRVWPVTPDTDEKALTARVTAQIEKQAPGFAAIVASSTVIPAPCEPATPARLTASARERIATPVRGLYLCGPDAEPACGLAIRAARQAAAFAVAQHKRNGGT